MFSTDNYSLVHPLSSLSQIPSRTWSLEHLKQQLSQSHGKDAAQTTFNNLESALVQTLLLAQTDTQPCRQCFHLVATEVIFNSSLHPLVTEVTIMHSQRAHDAMIMPLWRRNDVAMSFWRHNEIIIASCACWVCYEYAFQPSIHQSICKMIAILQTFSEAYSWFKVFSFSVKLCWKLFLRICFGD